MALPKKTITIFETQEVHLTGLSCDQVEQLLSIGTPDANGGIDAISARKRAEYVVNLGTGEDFNAKKKDVLFTEFFNAFNEVHTQMLELSGLKASTPGETLAVVEKSTSNESAAA